MWYLPIIPLARMHGPGGSGTEDKHPLLLCLHTRQALTDQRSEWTSPACLRGSQQLMHTETLREMLSVLFVVVVIIVVSVVVLLSIFLFQKTSLKVPETHCLPS